MLTIISYGIYREKLGQLNECVGIPICVYYNRKYMLTIISYGIYREKLGQLNECVGIPICVYYNRKYNFLSAIH